MTSDEFFEKFPEIQRESPYNREDGSDFIFDIIYIDGMHTYEQAYKDFVNSLRYSHEKTVWIFDDTLPWDPLSAYPNQDISLKYRDLMGITGTPWHGDVFKAIVAVHEFQHDFSYATHINNGNPQTIVWRAPAERVTFGGEDAIAKLDVYQLFENNSLLNPMRLKEILPLVGTPIHDKDFHEVHPSECVRRVSTAREQDLLRTACHVDALREQISDSFKDLKTANKSEVDTLREVIEQKDMEILRLTGEIKAQTDLLETKRRNIVRHIRQAVLKASIFLAACVGAGVAVMKFL